MRTRVRASWRWALLASGGCPFVVRHADSEWGGDGWVFLVLGRDLRGASWRLTRNPPGRGLVKRDDERPYPMREASPRHHPLQVMLSRSHTPRERVLTNRENALTHHEDGSPTARPLPPRARAHTPRGRAHTARTRSHARTRSQDALTPRGRAHTPRGRALSVTPRENSVELGVRRPSDEASGEHGAERTSGREHRAQAETKYGGMPRAQGDAV